MTLKEIGEFGFIKKISRGCLIRPDNIIKAIGDDAAAFTTAPDQLSLITTDLLVERVHFLRAAISGFDLGYKSLAVNLSDIAAMGGTPRYALASLGLPSDTDVDNVTDLYRGMTELGNLFNVAIIGGNISDSVIVFVSTTVFGNAAEQSKVLTRSAATAGERIAVTGSLGAAAAGLEILKQKTPLEDETGNSLRQAFSRPQPRIAEGQLLAEQGVKAAIDISDGLIADLRHLCKASHVGARIETSRIPIHPAARKAFGDSSLELSLSGGEDYELLFTAGSDVIDRVKVKASIPVTVIGQITADKTGKVVLFNKKGEPYNPAGMGWQHFAERS